LDEAELTRRDTLTVEERSERMSRIRGKDTAPELKLRRLVWAMGYRYRLHGKKLPGRPDLVFAGRRSVIFLHGCFWHGHDCGTYKRPRPDQTFWIDKLASNVRRDRSVEERLIADGWRVLTVWECELRDEPKVEEAIKAFLGPLQAARRRVDTPRS
jgi:DNA mismatch endonuclease (patch repair protein)